MNIVAIAGLIMVIGIVVTLTLGFPLRDAVDRANAIGAIQLMSASDNEGLPTREELKLFISESGE